MDSCVKIISRQTGGKRAARRLRHDGFIPGIIYGSTEAPVCVSIESTGLMKECYSSAFFSHIIEVSVNNKAEKVLPKNIDFDPVTDLPIHVDFQRVTGDSKVKIHIPIEFVDETKSPGMKKGGVLNVVIHQLECICPADRIPEKVTVSLAGHDIGSGFGIADVIIPDGIYPAHPERDAVIATIVGARVGSDDTASTASATTDVPSSS
jgi:large subunit ribosomal protein L25